MMGLPCFNRRLEQTSDYSSHIRAWIQSSARSLTEGLMGGAPVQNLFLNALDLLVNRNWIVGECRDSLRGKMRLQLIPQITLNRIKMVNVLVTRWSERQSQRCSGETSVVYLCQFAASPAPLVNPF